MNRPSSRLFFFLVCLSLLVFALAAAAVVAGVQERDLEQDTKLRLFFLRHHFKDEIRDNTQAMEGVLRLVTDRNDLRDAWQARDRSLMLELSFPLLQSFRKHFDITHFYFIDPDGTCLLRVHNPGYYGDRIQRLTLETAQAGEKQSSGLELGPMGTFTLRVIQPWIVDGRLLGYVELGQEVDDIFLKIANLVDAQYVLTVDKRLVDRTRWEQGLKMFGRRGDWDRYKTVVVAGSNVMNPGKEVGSYIEESSGQRTSFTIRDNGRTWYGGYDQLVDIGGRHIGKYLILFDVTDRKKENMKELGLTTILFAVGSIGFVYVLRRLVAAMNNNGASSSTPP